MKSSLGGSSVRVAWQNVLQHRKLFAHFSSHFFAICHEYKLHGPLLLYAAFTGLDYGSRGQHCAQSMCKTHFLAQFLTERDEF